MIAPHLSSRIPPIQLLHSIGLSANASKVAGPAGQRGIQCSAFHHSVEKARSRRLPLFGLVLWLAFLCPLASPAEQNRARDHQNLRAALLALNRGFPAEASHYLDRIPSGSNVQGDREMRRIRTLLAFHSGDLVEARRNLRELYAGRDMSPERGDMYLIYLVEELVSLRQHADLRRLRSSEVPPADFDAFKRSLQSHYPVLTCEVARHDGSLVAGKGSPVRPTDQFSDPLGFRSIMARKLEESDAMQLAVLARSFRSFAASSRGTQIDLDEQQQQLARNLSLCRQSLEKSAEELQVTSSRDRERIQEYLYRLYFLKWSLEGDLPGLFDLADFQLRNAEGPSGRLEGLYLFRKTMVHLLERKSLLLVDAHLDESQVNDPALFLLTSILGKIESIYEDLQWNRDAQVVSEMALSLERYLYSDGTEEDRIRMRRELLDASGENRNNRESIVMRMALNKRDRTTLSEELRIRDEKKDGEELLSLMNFRYGTIVPAF
jgi:hypothetical protein